MTRWVEPTPTLIWVNLKDFTGHAYLVLHQVKLSTTNVIFEKRVVSGRLYIEEVGVDLELCVHAHGHDIYPIMEASCNNNYFLDLISFGIGELILCNHGSDHMFFFDSISRAKFKHLSSVRAIPQPNLYFGLSSSITPWYLEIIMELHNFLWVLHQLLHSHWFQFFTGSELLNTQGHR